MKVVGESIAPGIANHGLRLGGVPVGSTHERASYAPRDLRVIMRQRYHDYDWSVKRLLERIRRSDRIAPINKRLLEDYARHRYSQGSSPAHILSQLHLLRSLAATYFPKKPFTRYTRRDFEKFFAEIEMGSVVNVRGARFKPSTILKYKKLVRFFWRWAAPEKPTVDNPTGYPAAVKWIDVIRTEKRVRQQPVGEILAESEVLAMLKASSLRDRAFVFSHYEGMTRIGDCWGYQWKDFEFRRDENGNIESAVVTLKGETKTGSRQVVLVESVPDLWKWKQAHPEGSDPEAFVWRNMSSNSDGGPMTYQRTRAMLNRIAARAGLRTRIHPNIFRRTRCTHLLLRGIPQEVVRRQGGWVEGSRAFYRYVRIIQRDIEDSFRRLAGLNVEQQKENPFRVKRCYRCGSVCSCLDANCTECEFPLSEAVIRELDERRATNLQSLREELDGLWSLLEAATKRDAYGQPDLRARERLLREVAARSVRLKSASLGAESCPVGR